MGLDFDEWNAEPYSRTFEDAWKAGAASRDAEVDRLKGMVDEIQAARYVQKEYNALLVQNHQLREQLAERDKQVKEACAALCYEQNWLIHGSETAALIEATKEPE